MKKIILSLMLILFSMNSFALDYDPCKDFNVKEDIRTKVPKLKFWYDREMVGYEKAVIKPVGTLMAFSEPNEVSCSYRVIFLSRKNPTKEMNFGVSLRYNEDGKRITSFQTIISDQVTLHQRKRK
ncbi:hypothetical protein [Morganella morganii]|uniref:hypothetical protein n=1 Tax=Morganella morganii TaxID=582 RepID=UPI001BDB7EEA|nr:hypothetical protein [Morganella morganii]MBT0460205.1 hypothetical protein [Morganella morganii subsp. morganii]